MTDLVVISLENWDGVWRRNQHLLWRIMLSDPAMRVLFVEPPDDPLHALRSGRRARFGRRATDEELPGRLWTMRPLKALPRRVDRRADERTAAHVVRTARNLGMPDPILWVNDPGGAEISRLTGWRTLYDMTDDWLSAQRPAAELARVASQESFLLAEADQVVACSPELQRRKGAQRSPPRDPIELVRNAVDTQAYRLHRARPADLPGGRVALYAGTLHADRLDLGLCRVVAERLSGIGTLVLVGPNALADAQVSALRHAGAILLGPRAHHEVIAYLQHADVLVVPHVVTPFTDSLDPIKLYEYQASARPVVSTPVAGFRETQNDGILMVDVDDFPDAVADAVNRTDGIPRGGKGRVPDWSERADDMLRIIRRMVR